MKAMDKTEKAITFDNLPQAVATLLQEVRELRSLTENHTTYGGFSSWMDVEELCEYLPGHPTKGTIYAWCAHKKIPFHFCGKAYCFFRTEIDKWMMKGGGR